jgi:heme oxygenase
MHVFPGAATAPSVIAQLRSTTSSAHAAIERKLGLMQPITLPRYVALLQGFDAFLAAWEPMVESRLAPPLRPWFRAGTRGAAARRDLVALDAPARGAVHLALSLPDLPAVLGSLYVVEGSALGAQVIAPVLHAGLGLHEGNGAAYFTAHKDATARRWREFRELLEAEAATDPGSACRAAIATFEALSQTLGDPEVESAA